MVDQQIDNHIAVPFIAAGGNYYIYVPSDQYTTLISDKIKQYIKLVAELNKIRIQLDNISDQTPWRIAYKQRSRYVDVLNDILCIRDFIKHIK